MTQIRLVNINVTHDDDDNDDDDGRYAGVNMRYDLDTNVTVITLPINTTADVPCRYINNRGEFDFQSRDLKLVSITSFSG